MNRRFSKRMLVIATAFAATAVLMGTTACSSGAADQPASGGSGSGDTVKIGLVTKTDSNPFFVKMRESAKESAEENGADLIALAGACRAS